MVNDSGDDLLSSTYGLRGVRFRLCDDWFFVDLLRVREIVRPTELRSIDGIPPFFAGAMTYRGEELLVLDLRERLNLPGGRREPDARIMLLTMPGKLLGVLVDEVSELLTLDLDTIRPPPSQLSSRIAPFFIGVADLRERTVTLLNIDRLLSAEELSHLHRLV